MNEGRLAHRAVTAGLATLIASLALVALLSAPATAPGQQYPVPDGLDHFKCYTAKQAVFKPRTVKFKDQFDSGATRVLKLRTVCNPVSKNGGKVINPLAHLACYATRDLKPSFDGAKVKVTNQFGSTDVEVRGPSGLCVPSLKRKGQTPPPTTPNPERVLDHFRCYTVKPVVAARIVKLKDQFGSTESRVGRLVQLCNPVAKNTGKVRRPKAHLACYSITDAQTFKAVKVRVRNQFGLASVTATKPATLCLPSLKEKL